MSEKPFSCASVSEPDYDYPCSSNVYGFFSESILRWIDEQIVPPMDLSEAIEISKAWRYLGPKKEPQQAKNKKKERSEIIEFRRARFQANRDQYMLAMLHAGVPYICAHPACECVTKLGIDHIVPLSKGGADETENFQFLCAVHNSAKGSSDAGTGGYPVSVGPSPTTGKGGIWANG